MQSSHKHPKCNKENFYWVSVYISLRKAVQKVLYICGLKESPLSIMDAVMVTISNGLINLPFSRSHLGLSYKGTDFRGLNVFHTRHLPTSPKHKLISLAMDRMEPF